MVGMVQSSYYRVPSGGKKGNKPSKATFHNTKGFVSQDVVVASIKDLLKHEFIDCGYRLMTSYLKTVSYIHLTMPTILRSIYSPHLKMTARSSFYFFSIL